MQENNRLYEVGFHLIPTLEESEAKEKFEAVKSNLEKHEAKIVSAGSPELISLAYQMSRPTGGTRAKYDKAYFSWLKFEVEPAQLGEIQEELEHNENVLRFLIIQTVVDGDHTTNKLNEQLKKQNRKPERGPVAENVEVVEEVVAPVEVIEPVEVEEVSKEENIDEDIDQAVNEIISGK